MYRFNNDYCHGAHPEVLKALVETNDNAYGGYGLDEVCTAAKNEISKYLGDVKADIHFLVGGTQANFTVIASALRSYQGVISADSGHIHVHETGAVEHVGYKILALPARDGKITAAQIKKVAQDYVDSDVQEHITQPKLVYISFPTEFGTIYSKQELIDISTVCKEYGLYLFVDGARMSYGLAAHGGDVTLADLAKYADVFYIGGTKCGAMFGEAVVIINDNLKPDFRSYIKQNGGMLAKGWTLGLQFYTLFKDGLYFEIAKKSIEQAQRIKNAFINKSIKMHIDSPTNQQFVEVDARVAETLAKNFYYENEGYTDDGKKIIRFCTAWSTKDNEVDALVEEINKL